MFVSNILLSITPILASSSQDIVTATLKDIESKCQTKEQYNYCSRFANAEFASCPSNDSECYKSKLEFINDFCHDIITPFNATALNSNLTASDLKINYALSADLDESDYPDYYEDLDDVNDDGSYTGDKYNYDDYEDDAYDDIYARAVLSTGNKRDIRKYKDMVKAKLNFNRVGSDDKRPDYDYDYDYEYDDDDEDDQDVDGHVDNNDQSDDQDEEEEYDDEKFDTKRSIKQHVTYSNNSAPVDALKSANNYFKRDYVEFRNIPQNETKLNGIDNQILDLKPQVSMVQKYAVGDTVYDVFREHNLAVPQKANSATFPASTATPTPTSATASSISLSGEQISTSTRVLTTSKAVTYKQSSIASSSSSSSSRVNSLPYMKWNATNSTANATYTPTYHMDGAKMPSPGPYMIVGAMLILYSLI